MTSGTRREVSPHVGQAKVMASTYGRCGSSPDWSVPVSSESSASEPTQIWWSSWQRQIGSGVPQ